MPENPPSTDALSPAALREEVLRLRREVEELQRAMTDLREHGNSNRESRRAALNLMQDAVESRQRAEQLNNDLREEMAERERAEAALRKSEGRNRIALEAAEMAAWDYEVEAGRITWSDQHYRLFGLEPDGEPATPEFFFKFIHPDHRTSVEAGLRQAVEETGFFENEFRIIRADGEVRWMNGFGRAVEKSDGRASRVTGVMFDVTARHQSEQSLGESRERLRLVVDNAREYAIFSMDLERTITSWNSGAERLLGYSEKEAIAQKGDIIFTPEDRAQGGCEDEVRTALAEGRATDERWHLRKDGTRFWGSGVMMSMHDATGEAIGFVKIFRDHTEQLRAQEELEKSRAEIWEALQETERARDEAEAAGKAKDQFLGIISHELRTPLTPVPLILDALKRRADVPESAKKSLEKIRRSVDEETHLIDDLLDLSRITHGKMEITRDAVNLHEALHRAIEVTRAEADQKSITLTVETGALNDRVLGDLFRLQQALWNLLRNACKFTPPEGQITVKSYNEPGRVVVEITDTGYGIVAEALSEIFQAFSQGGEAITREFGGLGLGLAIARAVVAAHEGSLAAVSEGRHQGARFIVSLPLAEPSHETAKGSGARDCA